MSNVNNAFGFRPLMRTLAGGRVSCQPAHKLVGDGTALFIGDAVKVAANGTKATSCITASSGAGTAVVLGVNLIYGAALAATDHFVVLADGNAVFLAQGDGSAAAGLVAANMSFNANINFGAGDTSLKISKHALVESTVANTDSLDTKIHKLWESPDNAFGKYARVEVTFNNQQNADQKAGA